MIAAKLCFVLLLSLAAGTFAADDSLEVYLRTGGTQLIRKQYQDALASFKNALRLDPDNFIAVKSLGLIHSRMGRSQQAKTFLEKAHGMNPADANVCNNLGTALTNLGRPGEAIEYYEKAVGLDTANAVFLTNLGQAYSRIGRIGKALPLLRRSLEIESSGVTMFSMGSCFATLQNHDSAEFYFQKAADEGINTAALFYFLGTVRNRLGKTGQARADYERAIKLDPDHKECLQALGMLHLSEDRFSEAAKQFARAVYLDSTFYPAWIGLGASYSFNQEPARSDSILQRLLSIDSTLGFQMVDFIAEESIKRKQDRR